MSPNLNTVKNPSPPVTVHTRVPTNSSFDSQSISFLGPLSNANSVPNDTAKFTAFAPTTLPNTNSVPNDTTKYDTTKFTGFSTTKPNNSIEINSISELQLDLNTRKNELILIQNELSKLAPSAEKLRETRSKIEKEFKDVSDARNKLTIELSQARAMYESDQLSIADTVQITQRETQTCKSLKIEYEQYHSALEGLSLEKKQLIENKNNCDGIITSYSGKLAKLVEETNTMKASIIQIRSESQIQQRAIQVNTLQLSQAKETHQLVKDEFESEQSKLDIQTKKTLQLQQQCNVQIESNF